MHFAALDLYDFWSRFQGEKKKKKKIYFLKRIWGGKLLTFLLPLNFMQIWETRAICYWLLFAIHSQSLYIFPSWIENLEKNQSLEYGVREGYVGLLCIIIGI